MKTYTYSHKLMGTELIVSIDSDNQTKADLAFADVLILGMDMEKEFSRFIVESPLSVLNTKKELIVSDRFIEVCNVALELYKKTNGVFNPFVQVKNLGYTKDFSESDSFSDIDGVTISENKIILTETQTLDFGGFLKGLFCDYAKKYITDFENALINLGGDIVIVGTSNLDIYNPILQKNDTSLSLTNTNIATSGIYKRNWKIDGKKYSHIVNPKTKQSTESDLCSVSIITDKGYIADAYATTSFILGSKKAVEFLDREKIDYVLITTTGEKIISKRVDEIT
jgi:thiamine biosynthesis lipoprotein